MSISVGVQSWRRRKTQRVRPLSLRQRLKLLAQLLFRFGRSHAFVLAVEGLRSIVLQQMGFLRHVDFCWSPKLTWMQKITSTSPVHAHVKMAALLFDYFGRFDSLVLAVDGLRCTIYLFEITSRHVNFCWSPKLTWMQKITCSIPPTLAFENSCFDNILFLLYELTLLFS